MHELLLPVVFLEVMGSFLLILLITYLSKGCLFRSFRYYKTKSKEEKITKKQLRRIRRIYEEEEMNLKTSASQFVKSKLKDGKEFTQKAVNSCVILSEYRLCQLQFFSSLLVLHKFNKRPLNGSLENKSLQRIILMNEISFKTT